MLQRRSTACVWQLSSFVRCTSLSRSLVRHAALLHVSAPMFTWAIPGGQEMRGCNVGDEPYEMSRMAKVSSCKPHMSVPYCSAYRRAAAKEQLHTTAGPEHLAAISIHHTCMGTRSCRSSGHLIREGDADPAPAKVHPVVEGQA